MGTNIVFQSPSIRSYLLKVPALEPWGPSFRCMITWLTQSNHITSESQTLFTILHLYVWLGGKCCGGHFRLWLDQGPEALLFWNPGRLILPTTHASKQDGLGDPQLPLAAPSLSLLWLQPTLAELSHRARPNLSEVLSASVSQVSSGVARNPPSSLQFPWTWDYHLTCFNWDPVVVRFSLKRYELVTIVICQALQFQAAHFWAPQPYLSLQSIQEAT